MIINVQKNLPQSDEFTFTAIDFERANNSQNSCLLYTSRCV